MNRRVCVRALVQQQAAWRGAVPALWPHFCAAGAQSPPCQAGGFVESRKAAPKNTACALQLFASVSNKVTLEAL